MPTDLFWFIVGIAIFSFLWFVGCGIAKKCGVRGIDDTN